MDLCAHTQRDFIIITTEHYYISSMKKYTVHPTQNVPLITENDLNKFYLIVLVQFWKSFSILKLSQIELHRMCACVCI